MRYSFGSLVGVGGSGHGSALPLFFAPAELQSFLLVLASSNASVTSEKQGN